MGWVAAGCCTVIAGLLFYKFLLSRPASDESEAEMNLDHESVTKFAFAVAEVAHLSQKTEPEATTTIARTMTAPPPRLEFSSTDGGLDAAKKETAQESMPPPPMPAPRLTTPSTPSRLNPPTRGNASVPPRPGNGFVRPPPSAVASLRVPITKPLPNASLAPTSSIMPPGKQASRKVILEPAHSPLDWAALTNDPKNRLRGKDAPGERLLRITPAQLKMQNGRKGRDVWTVYQGKVYNITPYVPFHPGGAGEILRGAGKDSVKLFMEVHPWVNWDGMLGECLVGILVGEDEATNGGTNTLDEMD